MRALQKVASFVVGAALTVAAFASLPVADAQAADRVVIDTGTKAKKGLYPIAVPAPQGDGGELAKTVTSVQAFDLGVSSWFKVLDPRSFLADLGTEGMGIDPPRWKDVGAFGVVKSSVTRQGGKVKLTFKLYELERGATPVLEREYFGSEAEVRAFTHKWCNDVVRHFTGEEGFFGSRITFATTKRGARAIQIVDFDGYGARTITNNSSVNMLPAFSPSGAMVAFTSYMRGNPDLYVTSAAGGTRARKLAAFPGMNTGAAWSPDGSKVAVTLTRDGNPEIYLLDAMNGKVVKRLTNNRYIDTSPAFSADGRELAFVSNREGGPQIFVMGADGSNQRRVSTTGNYNQTPAWSPKKGTRLIAYTARDDVSGRSDIVSIDSASGQMTRITQNQGNNEEPTWAPNGRVVAFSSTRSEGSGIYLANADGTGEQKLVFRGGTTSPDWGPLP